jgi:predicted MPP superfamily phosphohydrolase
MDMTHSNPAGLILRLLCTILISMNTAIAQEPFKIFLVGDAGDHREAGETLVNLHKELIKNPHSAVVFLGDNSYKDELWGILPFGFKGFDSSENTMEKVRSQLALLNNYKGSAFFIPGNHDWWNRSTYEKGYPKLVMEESFIEENLKNNSTIANPDNVFLPKNGNYGPAVVEFNHHTVRLVFIDTYRIIQTGIKKGKIPLEEKTFYERLDSVIREGWLLKQKIIVVAHHPVQSIGPYNRLLKKPYLFGRIKSSSPDFPSYRAMSEQINKILKRYPGIYYGSGHLHALQYLYTRDSIHYIISGAGSREKKLSGKDISKYDASLSPDEFLLWNTGGFFSIEFSGKTDKTILFYDNGSRQCSLPE